MNIGRSEALLYSRLMGLVRLFLFGLIGGLLMIIASRVIIPFVPVQFTLQTFVITTMSVICQRRVTYASLAVFLVLCGPRSLVTSGYVIGFFLVPPILYGVCDKSNLEIVCRLLMSYLLILVLGTIVLAKFVGIKVAVCSGFLFFIPAEILKAVLTFVVVKRFSLKRS